MLPSFFDCPRREIIKIIPDTMESAGFKFQPRDQVVAAIVGTATHAAAEELIKLKKEAGESADVHIDMAIGKGIDSFYDQSSESEGIIYDDITNNNNTAEAQIRQLTGFYKHGILPFIESDSALTEVSLEATINGIDVTGHADIISQHDLRDFKSSKKQNYLAQLGMYSILNRAMGGEDKDLYVDFLPRTSIDKPFTGKTIVKYNRTIAEKVAISTIEHVKFNVELFNKTGDPYSIPANPKSMLCSNKYCTAFNTSFCKLGGMK